MNSMGGFTPPRGRIDDYAVNEAPPITLASAATVLLGPAESNNIILTGTAAITSFGPAPAGARRALRFAGILVLTHNATSLFLSAAGANITTAVNDAAEFISLGNGNWYLHSYTRAAGAALVSAGGLVNWTEAVSIAAPNAAKPVVSFAATNAATDVDAVIRPKGTGGLAAHVADSTAAGGDKRGTAAVDWQMDRVANTEVASGGRTTISGGSRNTASNSFATVGGGTQNLASGGSAVIAGGEYNTASGSAFGPAIGGGSTNTASENYSTVAGGFSNTAGSIGGWIPGGRQASTRNVASKGAFSGGVHSSIGDSQGGFLPTKAVTSLSATPVDVNVIDEMPNNSVYTFVVKVAARTDASNCAGFVVSGAIKRDANAGTTAILGAVTIQSWRTGAATWAATVVADTATGGLAVRVTGDATRQTYWTAIIETAEVAL